MCVLKYAIFLVFRLVVMYESRRGLVIVLEGILFGLF